MLSAGVFYESSRLSLAKTVGLIRHVEPGVTVAPADQLGRDGDGRPCATCLSNHKTLLNSFFALSIVVSVWIRVKL